MRDIYDLLFDIKDRYYAYVGGFDIYRLHSFLDGYRFARRELGLERSEQEKDFGNFHKWLQEKFELRTNNSWSHIIVFITIDERKAVESFYELLEEFINRERNLKNDSTDDKSES